MAFITVAERFKILRPSLERALEQIVNRYSHAQIKEDTFKYLQCELNYLNEEYKQELIDLHGFECNFVYINNADGSYTICPIRNDENREDIIFSVEATICFKNEIS